MSYEVIARKWRPQTFEEVTGQEAITQTLRNALEHDRLHHAYLFAGARGVGKTTTARLLAKALNCHRTAVPNPQPCASTDPEACASCREISESRSIDVLEFDAASHTGVDDIRQIILESINIAPARDRYKVFIIDEVHMLSTSSFNALLKTLEEPPPNVAFVMATTELHKVPDTILSRCQEFQFRTIPVNRIFSRLKQIAVAENVTVTDEALREIARSGEGSMRDAQSNFDQVISFSGESIDVVDVAKALGIASSEMLTRIVTAVAHNQPREALTVVDELISRGHDLRAFCRDLLSFFRDLLVTKIAGENEYLLETAALPTDELVRYAQHFSESDLVRFFNSLAETESKLREATGSRYVLEIGLVKLVEMRRVVPIETILERLARLEESARGRGVAAVVPPAEEKKTLNSDPPADTPFPVPPAAPKSASEAPGTAIADPPEAPPEAGFEIPDFLPDDIPDVPRTGFDKDQFLASVPIKLPPISSEDLEHFDDSRLDAQLEFKLVLAGDDLLPIEGASSIIENLVGKAEPTPETAVSGDGNGSRPKVSFPVPDLDDDEDGGEPPVLPDDPSPAELREFAERHPAVRRVIKRFRGRIVSVEKLGKN